LKTTVGETLKVTDTSISGIISGVIKLFGYLIFFLAATEILQLVRLAEFLKNVLNYLPNLFIGILILIIGFLSIDFIADYLEKMMEGMKVEGSDVIIPILRGFMFLVVLLLSLHLNGELKRLSWHTPKRENKPLLFISYLPWQSSTKLFIFPITKP
jgi:uncharacterized membrane protein